jgi:hypothetical protein
MSTWVPIPIHASINQSIKNACDIMCAEVAFNDITLKRIHQMNSVIESVGIREI